MKKNKNNYLFSIFMILALVISYFPVTAYADGSVTTNGVICLYDDIVSTTPSSSQEVPKTGTTKSAGKSSFPSTGEMLMNSIKIIGLLLVGVVILFFFYRNKRKEKK